MGGGAFVADKLSKRSSDNLSVLTVPKDRVTSSDSLTEIADPSTCMTLSASFDLPYGSLVWANDDAVAAALVPTANSNPLTQVALLNLGSGTTTTVLDKAIGAPKNFEIYDVRASSAGLIWIEANILDDIWQVYTAPLSNGSLGKAVLVDQGGGDFETPSLAVAGNQAFWQVLPEAQGGSKTADSVLKCAPLGSKDVQIAYTSQGRMATPPYALNDSVVITPRTNTSSIHYQLTRLELQTLQTLDTMALPASMKPLEAGYGDTGFIFSFDAIYNYGDGIANLGTYAPMQAATDGNYNALPWFCFNRAPTAAPAWCGKYLMVKSTNSVNGIDLQSKQYFALNVENGADDYGDYLASTGSRAHIVTYANIKYTPLDGSPLQKCHVRVWTPTPS